MTLSLTKRRHEWTHVSDSRCVCVCVWDSRWRCSTLNNIKTAAELQQMHHNRAQPNIDSWRPCDAIKSTGKSYWTLNLDFFFQLCSRLHELSFPWQLSKLMETVCDTERVQYLGPWWTSLLHVWVQTSLNCSWESFNSVEWYFIILMCRNTEPVTLNVCLC